MPLHPAMSVGVRDALTLTACAARRLRPGNAGLALYDAEAEPFFAATVTVDLTSLYTPLLRHLELGAAILDAGRSSSGGLSHEVDNEIQKQLLISGSGTTTVLGMLPVRPLAAIHERTIAMRSTAYPEQRPVEQVTVPRGVEQLVVGQPTMDGAGVKLTRVLTQSLQRRLDPFLLLDNFDSDRVDDYIAGFPEHPHRGFETVTYMINGRMRHRDSAGHEGRVGPGGVQWMIAGRGLIHSEIPEQEQGLMEGFQLWLNLPARDKLRAPWYCDFQASELPGFATETGAEVVLIAGESHGLQGAVTRAFTEPLILDLHLSEGGHFAQALAADRNAFVYVYRGELQIAGTPVARKQMAILNNRADSDGLRVAAAAGETRALVIAGRPLNEPIVQQGPFVMNSRREIDQAVMDFQAGRLQASGA